VVFTPFQVLKSRTDRRDRLQEVSAPLVALRRYRARLSWSPSEPSPRPALAP